MKFFKKLFIFLIIIILVVLSFLFLIGYAYNATSCPNCTSEL